MLLHFCDPKEALLHIYVYNNVSGTYNGYHKSGHVLHGVSIHEQATATLLELPLPKAKRSRKQSVVTSTTFDGTAAHGISDSETKTLADPLEKGTGERQ